MGRGRLGALLACLLGVAASGHARGATPNPFGSGAPPPPQEDIAFSAERAQCSGAGCTLEGDANLVSGPMRLRADQLTIRLDDCGQFGGAQARGHVLFDDGSRSLQSDVIVLGADRIQARLNHGVLQLRREPLTAAPPGNNCPVGPFALTVHGDLQRDGSGAITARGSTLTLCDCGDRVPPSWQLYAPKVLVRVGARATVYWPQLRINVFGIKLVPITPPLLPISLPLTPRAFGLLVPQVTFLGPPWPTVDVPLFVPITPSWDVTVAPGVRGDWGFAPRLGLRLRGAPSTEHRLNADLHMTWDLHHQAAQRFTARTAPAQRVGAGYADMLAQRRALVWRSRMDLQHSVRLLHPPPLRAEARSAPALEWHSALTWVSDDAVLADLGVAAAQRVATYLPSRTLLTLRHPRVVAEAGVDGMLRLDSTVVSTGGGRRPVLSNTTYDELQTLHRLPYGQARLFGRPWAKHWRLQGDVMATRYGAIVPRRNDQNVSGQHSQSGARFVGQALWGQTLGPVRGRVGLQLDGVLFATAGAPFAPRSLQDGVLVADAAFSLPLQRRFAAGHHLLVPVVHYRALARPNPRAVAAFLAGEDALDPYLERAAVHQLVLGLKQTLRAGPFGLCLDVGQPFDLLGHVLGQPSGRINVVWGPLLRLETLASVNLHTRSNRLQHLAQHFFLGSPKLGISGAYLRAAPGAERFLRTVYELSAAPRAQPDAGGAAWAHTLSASAHVALPLGLKVRYGLTLALPRPDGSGPAGPSSAAALTDLLRQYATAQSLDVAYSSPCNCWGFSATLSASPQALGQTLRVQVLLTVADTRLGA